jgi:hypothetical protein
MVIILERFSNANHRWFKFEDDPWADDRRRPSVIHSLTHHQHVLGMPVRSMEVSKHIEAEGSGLSGFHPYLTKA